MKKQAYFNVELPPSREPTSDLDELTREVFVLPTWEFERGKTLGVFVSAGDMQHNMVFCERSAQELYKFFCNKTPNYFYQLLAKKFIENKSRNS